MSDTHVLWFNFLGMISRGRLDNLMLFRLPDRTTLKRSPGPGPIRLKDWRPYAKRLLSQRRVILHSDSARAYKHPIQRVPHVSVVHCKKKIENKWVPPHYVKYTSVELPDGQRLRVVGGTQYLDGFFHRIYELPPVVTNPMVTFWSRCSG